MLTLKRYLHSLKLHPCIWVDTGFNRSFMAVEQQCCLCNRFRHWTGKFIDYPGMEWADGRASRSLESKP